MSVEIVERILEKFQSNAEGYGWVFDGSHLWEHIDEREKNYAEAKYDIVYALLDAVRDETGIRFRFIIDALPEDDDDAEFLIFKGDRVLYHGYIRPVSLDIESYKSTVKDIVEKILK